MPHTRRVAVAIALVGAAASGCASGTPGSRPTTSGKPSAGFSCNGQAYVDVDNRSAAAVDVYAYPPVGGDKRYLGSVGPGTQRLPLGDAVGYIYAEVGGQRVTGSAESRGHAGSISFTRVCDESD
jgi:hypothetical protein